MFLALDHVTALFDTHFNQPNRQTHGLTYEGGHIGFGPSCNGETTSLNTSPKSQILSFSSRSSTVCNITIYIYKLRDKHFHIFCFIVAVMTLSRSH